MRQRYGAPTLAIHSEKAASASPSPLRGGNKGGIQHRRNSICDGPAVSGDMLQVRTFPESRPCGMVVSTAGIEPATPGFIPLRLSPPLPRSWSGLSLRHWPRPLGAAHPVSTPSPEISRCLARDWHAESSAKRSPNLSRSIVPFPIYNPQLNQESCALSRTELRGHSPSHEGVVADAIANINSCLSVMLPPTGSQLGHGFHSELVTFLPVKVFYPTELRGPASLLARPAAGVIGNFRLSRPATRPPKRPAPSPPASPNS